MGYPLHLRNDYARFSLFLGAMNWLRDTNYANDAVTNSLPSPCLTALVPCSTGQATTDPIPMAHDRYVVRVDNLG